MRTPIIKLPIKPTYHIAAAAIAPPSQGSLGLIGLQSPIIKTPKIMLAIVPPINTVKKTIKLAANGYFNAKFFTLIITFQIG